MPTEPVVEPWAQSKVSLEAMEAKQAANAVAEAKTMTAAAEAEHKLETENLALKSEIADLTGNIMKLLEQQGHAPKTPCPACAAKDREIARLNEIIKGAGNHGKKKQARQARAARPKRVAATRKARQQGEGK